MTLIRMKLPPPVTPACQHDHMEQTVAPDTRSEDHNPWIILTLSIGLGLFVIGGIIALQAHNFLENVTWDGDDVDAKRHQEHVGQALLAVSALSLLVCTVLVGVRYETNRVLKALRSDRLARIERPDTNDVD